MVAAIRVEGECDGRFENVRKAFEASFSAGEVGAAVAVMIDGRTVLDLWGGHTDPDRTTPWKADTVVNVYSTTKGMTALCAHRMVDEGRLDLDAPVARYWPEFAQGGKEALPVRYLLTHQAGLAAIRKPIPFERRYDWDYLCGALAEQEPWWTPGEAHGYHAMTFGYLIGELVRRIDGRSLGTFFREEIADPLGADFHIGLDEEHHRRCAHMIQPPPPPPGTPDLFAELGKNPESLTGKAFTNPPVEDGAVNSREWRGAEIPAGNGHGTALSLARIYGALARGGELDGFRALSGEGIERARAEQVNGPDKVLAPLHSRFSLGFFLTQPLIQFGPNPGAFGHPGAGGSIAFADPEAGLGFAYVMNQMQAGITGDARGLRLIHEVYEALKQ